MIVVGVVARCGYYKANAVGCLCTKGRACGTKGRSSQSIRPILACTNGHAEIGHQEAKKAERRTGTKGRPNVPIGHFRARRARITQTLDMFVSREAAKTAQKYSTCFATMRGVYLIVLSGFQRHNGIGCRQFAEVSWRHACNPAEHTSEVVCVLETYLCRNLADTHFA